MQIVALTSTNVAIRGMIAVVVWAIRQSKQTELVKRAGVDARGEAAVAGGQK